MSIYRCIKRSPIVLENAYSIWIQSLSTALRRGKRYRLYYYYTCIKTHYPKTGAFVYYYHLSVAGEIDFTKNPSSPLDALKRINREYSGENNDNKKERKKKISVN